MEITLRPYLTFCCNVPQSQVVPVINGDQVLFKWDQGVHLPLVSLVLLDLLTSAVGLDNVLIGGEDELALDGQALKGVWLLGSYNKRAR